MIYTVISKKAENDIKHLRMVLKCPQELYFLVRAALDFLLILKGQAGAKPDACLMPVVCLGCHYKCSDCMHDAGCLSWQQG